MDARAFRRRCSGVLLGMLALQCTLPAVAQSRRGGQHVAHSQNFIVFADSPQWAEEVAQAAETHRRELAVYWLGQELPPWSERIPLHVHARPDLGAGGETRFSLLPGGVGNWMMSVQGTRQRILDSVLPHEITHTIFATHFAPLGKYVPRWADEGACTTVEHPSEKRKHAHFLQQFLRTGRGLAFNRMFSLKEYPDDILPLYAQGHSAVQFLLDQAGPRTFVQFLEDGMRTEQWEVALRKHYAYPTIGRFQVSWNQWLADGSPSDLTAYAPLLQNRPSPAAASAVALASADVTQAAPANLASAGTGASDSWYRRRLSAAQQMPAKGSNEASPQAQPLTPSSGAAPAILPSVAGGDAIPLPNQPSIPPAVSAAHPQSPQSSGVQVLEWGASVPIPGIGTTAPTPAGRLSSDVQMVPLMR